MQRKWQIKLVLTLTFLGILGIIAIIPYELTMLYNDPYYQDNPNLLPVPIIVTLNSIFQMVLLFLLVLIGTRMQASTQLGMPKIELLVYEKKWQPFSKKWILMVILVSFILSAIIIFLDLYIFSPNMHIPEEQTTKTVWWHGILAMLYGGITEELMVRLFGMTLLVWILARITRKKREDIPNSYYYIAIILTALLFGIGHLPATINLFGGLSAIIVARTLILNGLLGLWFGYLYWKKGLEYAIIAHMSADLFVHVLFMQLFY